MRLMTVRPLRRTVAVVPVLAMLLGIGAISPAKAAVHNFPAFNPAVSNALSSYWFNDNLGLAPAGVWTGFEVLVDWQGAPHSAGNPSTADQTSNKAQIYFSNFAGHTFFNSTAIPTGSGLGYINAPYGADNGSLNVYEVVPLRFRGVFDTPITGGSPIHFYHRQIASLQANGGWSNVRVALTTTVAEALNATPVTLVDGVNTFTRQYSRHDNVVWYEFTLAQPVDGSSGQAMTIDTIGNTLLGGQNNFDTDMALYNAAGNVVATSGGFFNSGFSRSSMIIAGMPAASIYPNATAFGNAGATLPAGTYYLAVGPAEFSAQANFTVYSDVDVQLPLFGQGPFREITGNHVVNITFSRIPEPDAQALTGAAVIALTSRRQRRGPARLLDVRRRDFIV